MIDTDHAVTVALAEYERLKHEQAQRIGFRDNLLYAGLASIATICAVTATADTLTVLMLMPLASTVLGWTYLANDHQVSAIGRYIRTELDPRLVALTGQAGQGGPLFGWEYDHRDDHRRRSRKGLQLAVDQLAFTLPPVAALAVLWAAGPHSALLAAASIAELVPVLVLASQIVRYADLGTSHATP